MRPSRSGWEVEPETVKLGILADIHCNAPALDTALALLEAEEVDDLLVVGDAIYEYRFSAPVVRRLRDCGARFILGNHEEAYLASLNGDKELPDADLICWLRAQPLDIKIEADGRKLLAFHATPWEPRNEYLMPNDPRMAEFSKLGYDVVIYGHTHWQLAEFFGSTLVVNPGSVGEPRDHRNGMRGSVAVLDTASLEVTHHDFDV